MELIVSLSSLSGTGSVLILQRGAEFSEGIGGIPRLQTLKPFSTGMNEFKILSSSLFIRFGPERPWAE